MHTDFPKILGILNITEDSFSDGGTYLQTDDAINHALRLARDGADCIDIGPASSNPDGRSVPPEEEIRRLEPVLERLEKEHISVSIDSFQPQTQMYCARRGVSYLNDIRGFPDESVYPALTQASCALIVMHSVQRSGRATRVESDPQTIVALIEQFFEQRLQALTKAGIAEDRIIIDPGMGFFLGSNPEPSLEVLRAIPRLKRAFGRPVLISVSRKSFLGSITAKPAKERGAATLAAEMYATLHGADYIRTHDPAALRDALTVRFALDSV